MQTLFYYKRTLKGLTNLSLHLVVHLEYLRRYYDIKGEKGIMQVFTDPITMLYHIYIELCNWW